MYRTTAGERRPLARFGKQIALWYDDFDRMEWTAGPGGQLHSFEAVFGPRGTDGQPALAWDRATGAVQTDVTKQWQKYDIQHILETRWAELGPKLKGKIHVFMGDVDTFYLEGATIRVKETLKKLNSDAVVEIVPGKDHFTLYSADLRDRLRREMTDSFLTHHKP